MLYNNFQVRALSSLFKLLRMAGLYYIIRRTMNNKKNVPIMQLLVIPYNKQRIPALFLPSFLHKCIIHGTPFHSSDLSLIYPFLTVQRVLVARIFAKCFKAWRFLQIALFPSNGRIIKWVQKI